MATMNEHNRCCDDRLILPSMLRTTTAQPSRLPGHRMDELKSRLLRQRSEGEASSTPSRQSMSIIANTKTASRQRAIYSPSSTASTIEPGFTPRLEMSPQFRRN